MEKSGEKMMMKKKEKEKEKEKETEVGESSTTTSISNIWGSSWEFVEQGITTPLLNLFSYFFTTKTTTTTQPTTTKLSPPPTKSTEDQLLSSTRSIAPQTLRLNGRPPRPPVNSGRGGQTN